MPFTDYTLPIDKNNSPLWWGEIADLGKATIWKAENQDTGMLLFGFGVVQGSNPQGVTYPVDSTSKFAGVLLSTDTREKVPGITVDANGYSGYPPATGAYNTYGVSRLVSVIRQADRIGVPIDSNVTANGPVYLRCGNGTKGVFTAAADGTNTILIPKARFLFPASGTPGALGTGFIVLEGVL